MKERLPLVYACSGCSSAAQTANDAALALDRQGAAEMSCIAGVGGDVPALVRLAKSGRRIVVLDGCPLQCAKNCLARHQVQPDHHYVLSDLGVPKRFHADPDPENTKDISARVLKDLSEMPRADPGPGGD